MTQTTPNQDVMARLQELVRANDYAGARKFMLEHFKDLPEPMQQKLAAELMANSTVAAAKAKTGQADKDAEFVADMLAAATEQAQETLQQEQK